MKTLVLALAILWPHYAAWAQLAPPNAAGVSFGHVHVIARDVESEKAIWIGLGGTAVKIGDLEAIKFPGVFIFITKGTPAYAEVTGTGIRRFTTEISAEEHQAAGRPQLAWGVVPAGASNEGNVLSKIGFRLQPGKGIVERLQGQGVRISLNSAKLPDNADVYTTENMRITTLQGAANQKEPAIADQFHFDMPRYTRREALLWYADVLGVALREKGDGFHGDIPGLSGGLAFGETAGSPDAPVPSQGHTLDHIGFEVVNLEAFCKKLEAKGIIFEYPYSKIRYKGFASVGFIDPWGGNVELTEGLNKF